MDTGCVEVEQDHQPVVDSVAPDAPLVHQGLRVRLRLLGRDVVAPERLCVDDDLGLGLGLDGIDDQLGLLTSLRAEQLSGVIDGLAIDRLGERRSGGRDETWQREADDQGRRGEAGQ